METRQHWRDTMVDAIYVTGWTVSGLATLATILALIMKEAANWGGLSSPEIPVVLGPAKQEFEQIRGYRLYSSMRMGRKKSPRRAVSARPNSGRFIETDGNVPFLIIVKLEDAPRSGDLALHPTNRHSPGITLCTTCGKLPKLWPIWRTKLL
jgi:hypothetical protein